LEVFELQVFGPEKFCIFYQTFNKSEQLIV